MNRAVKEMTTKQGIATLRVVCVQSGASGAHVLIPATAENAIDHVNVRTKMMKAMTKKIAIHKIAQVYIRGFSRYFLLKPTRSKIKKESGISGEGGTYNSSCYTSISKTFAWVFS